MRIHIFEEVLSVSAEDLQSKFTGHKAAPWAEFILNPRRLRGSDFLMRWSQGVWSEERITEAINHSKDFYALPYGPSGTAPDDDVRKFELYFERLEKAGLGGLKRPDLLIFNQSDQQHVDEVVHALGGVQELPFTPEEELKQLLASAIVAVECENSLWKAKQMPHYNQPMRPMRRLGGQPGFVKSAVLPTIILKEEDRTPLVNWQARNKVPIHIWHLFYDEAYGLALDVAEQLIYKGQVEPTVQKFQAPGGATSEKIIYKFPYHHGYLLGSGQEEPELLADCIIDGNGHILPYVRFKGGRLMISPIALQILKDAVYGK
jgi:AccI restriction endonuclease